MKKQKNAVIMLCVLVSFLFCGGAQAVQNALTPVYLLLLDGYTVTPSAGANGTISPSTAQRVNHGSTTQFTVTPDTGYTASVGGTCGGSLVGATYTTNAITANCTVVASFSLNSYAVTPSAGAHGTISPATPQTINHGSTTQFTVTPDTGYTASVGGTCGGSLVGATYTTNAITANCTVVASFAVVASPMNLNDTGINWGGSYPNGNNPGCTGEEIGAQDCSHGRDVTHNDNADGHAGFSFTKIANSGAALLSTATIGSGANDWACTRDNVTGLIWEVKTSDGGLRDQNDSYSWYNTDSSTNGGANGYENPGDTCEGYVSGQPATYCNTQVFAARVNAVGLCGQSDWRMPTRKELRGIVSFDRVWPAIDTTYFPNTPEYSVVWSGSPVADGSDGAWGVDFSGGVSYIDYRSNNYQVRLVRGGQ